MSAQQTNGALHYLATPYSRYPYGPDSAFIEACKLAGALLKLGVRCYSPIAHTHPIAFWAQIDPLDHSIWLPFDQAIMERCDCLLVAHLDGWQESYGIAQEIRFFERAIKPIFDLDPVTLEQRERQRSRPPRERYDGLSESELQQAKREYLGHGSERLAHGKTASEQGGASA